MDKSSTRETAAKQAQDIRAKDASFANWAKGYGVIQHNDLTQVRIHEFVQVLIAQGSIARPSDAYELLVYADKLTNAAMWLVVHSTYAKHVYLDGRELQACDFKQKPEGHTGGSLNMVPAYVGYLAINALCNSTRSWMMGQGHCVSAIDSINLLVGNLQEKQASRYQVSDEGLSRFVQDFYSYRIRPDGKPESPLGSHVNPYTAGGMIEGGYLGFAELLYPHAPLPGESLVAFLSDGAFEEQRGSDWVPRWWRSEDSGLALPIMIANGRRIDQRTTMAQQGGIDWFRKHLELNGFDPIDVDGRDPAAFAWAIHEMESRLQSRCEEVQSGNAAYPVNLPYAIAEAPKGFGFSGSATNRAHNLPLSGNPCVDEQARNEFIEGAKKLWVDQGTLQEAQRAFRRGIGETRLPESEHPLATRDVTLPVFPEPPWKDPAPTQLASPMEGLDAYFVEITKANPQLRPRVGNPDELRSNRMNKTLDHLRHRVTSPEKEMAEAVDGAVITALNEEAVVCAALGNKGGINLAVTYEAFGSKMFGALRQEIIFSRHQKEVGRPAKWLSVPILLSSHTWENGKNEQSHQDPSLVESLLGEMSDTSRALFPADWNSALATLQEAYSTHAQIWGVVAPKNPMPLVFSKLEAERLLQDGAIETYTDENPVLILCAVGAYQFSEVGRASERLQERGVSHRVVYMVEPGKFRSARDTFEASHLASEKLREELFPANVPARVFLAHTRPEPLAGVVRPLDTGSATTKFLGYVNRGGTLDTFGMLFANKCTWAHVLEKASEALGMPSSDFLTEKELVALSGRGDPYVFV